MAIYCINPSCPERENSHNEDACVTCGTPLLLQGRYKLLTPLRSLSEGDGIEIFKASDLQNPAAEKVIKVITFPLKKYIQLQRREAHVLKYLDHPGIPHSDLDCQFIIELENGPELHCLVTEYIIGEDLKSWLEREGPINQSKAIDWLNQLAQILHALHSFKFFHRDIKPQNIILNPDGRLVLIDFGAARDVSNSYLSKLSPNTEQSDLTDSLSDLTTFFSPGYASIEAMNGRAIPQSDFFSLGRTLVHLITGIHPSDLPHDRQQAKLLWRDKAFNIEKPFADYLDQLMSVDIQERPYNTASLLRELEKLPKKLKRHQLFHSKGIRLLGLVSIIGVLGLGGWLGQRYWANQLIVDALKEQNRGDLVEAREKYEQAIQINPSNFLTYNYLATLCVQLKDLDCAIANYQRAIPYIPDDEKWVAYYNLGRVHDDLESYSVARENYEQAIQLSNGEQLYPINNLVRLDLLSGNAKGAKERLLPLLQLTDDSDIQGAIYKNLGWAEFELGQYVEAQKYLKKSIAKSPNRAGAYCLLAKTQQQLKQFDSSYVQNCLLLDTELPEVSFWKSELLERVSNNPQ